MTSNSHFVCPPVTPSNDAPEALEATENRVEIKDTLVCCQTCNGLGRILKSKAATPAVGGDRERIAKIIYEIEPYHESGEYVDGFQVSPGGSLSWEQAVTRDAEFGDDPLIGKITEFSLRCADALIAALAATPAVRGEARDKIAAIIGGQHYADFEEDGCGCSQCDDEREACRKLADQILALVQPASPLRESVNDNVREIVYQMSPSDQYDLAFKVAENVGYMLVREPYPDSPHLASLPASPLRGITLEQIEDVLCEAFGRLDEEQKVHNGYVMTGAHAVLTLLAAPPEQPDPGTGRDDVIAECAAIADKYDDCGGSFIAQKIRDLY